MVSNNNVAYELVLSPRQDITLPDKFCFRIGLLSAMGCRTAAVPGNGRIGATPPFVILWPSEQGWPFADIPTFRFALPQCGILRLG
jgi:hypothetical protein